MDFELDKLCYGMASRDQLKALYNQTFLDAEINVLSRYTFPPNSGQSVKDELNEMASLTEELYSEASSMQDFLNYDGNVDLVFIDFLVTKMGMALHEAEGHVNAILNDVDSLIVKLKYYFQRPRPYQLALYCQLKLFPFQSICANSPSYPSLSACRARVLALTLGNINPRAYQPLLKLCDHISISRLYLGHNFQSDIDYAFTVADQILKNNEYKIKYKL